MKQDSRRFSKALLAVLASALTLGTLAFAQKAAHALTSAEVAKLKGPDRQKILEEGARKEGKVVLYSTMIVNQLLRPLQESFQKKYPGVKLEYWRGDTAPIMQKVTAERRANALVHDVLEYSGTAVMTAIKGGAVESFYSPSLEQFDPALYDTANGMWAGTRISYFGTAYNTKQIGPKDAPKTFDDLLNPKWKGKMAWTISDTGSLQFISTIMIARGEKAGEEYLKKLAGQEITPFNESARALVDRVGQGEYAIGLHIYAHHPIISRNQGAPLSVAVMEPVDSGVAGIQIAKGAPHPHAAMLLIDLFLSPDGQNIVKKANYFPVNPTVAPEETLREVVPRLNNLKEVVFRPKILIEKRDRSLELSKKYFER